MTDTEILERLTSEQALACTMLGEARGDAGDGSSLEERAAVGCVVRNRLRIPKRFGDTLKAVCLQRKQFSCWNENDPNRLHLLAVAYRLVTNQPTMDPLVEETLFLAEGIERGLILDQVKRATHYYSPKSMKPAGRVPVWAKGAKPVARVGGHLFFRGV
jgi:N-acetylmuramoyl-L-alanine amidase